MAALVWPGVGDRLVVRRILATALFATTALAFVQLLVVASDVSGEAPWSSFGSLDAATATDAGMAFAIRIALALSMWLVVFRVEISHREVYWSAVSIPAVGLLATWRSLGQRRPEVPQSAHP